MKAKPIVNTIKGLEFAIYITAKGWKDIQYIVSKCDTEVAWMCEATRHENDKKIIYLVDKLYLWKQDVTATTTNMEPEASAKLIETVEAEGSKSSNLKCHCHSHVNMITEPSGTDDEHFQDIVNTVDSFGIMLIVNKHNDIYARVVDYNTGYILDDVNVKICSIKGYKTEEEWDKLIDELVEVKEPVTHTIDRNINNTIDINNVDMTSIFLPLHLRYEFKALRASFANASKTKAAKILIKINQIKEQAVKVLTKKYNNFEKEFNQNHAVLCPECGDILHAFETYELVCSSCHWTSTRGIK